MIARVFLNSAGIHSIWRLLVYLGLCAGIEFAVGFVLREFHGPGRGLFSPEYLLLSELLSFVSVFGGALLMAWFEQRSPGVYGLPRQGAFGKLFWLGCLLGLLEVSFLIGLIAAFGGYSFGTLALHGTEIMRWTLLWAVTYLFVGLFEEFSFRGYTQFTLADGIGFWPAAVFLSLLFGAVHLRNPGEGPVGAVSVAITGLVFAFALRRTGNLWLAVGWHASFDFGETFLYSVPNSGIVFPGHLSNAALQGPKWLMGGTIGPEGSVFCFLTMGISFLAIHLLFPAKNKTQPRIENPSA
jgi:membrane protease YdiL (CAAX protease family)